MNPVIVMQTVITKEIVAVMAVPVIMDGIPNQIVQVIILSIDRAKSPRVPFHRITSQYLMMFCFEY